MISRLVRGPILKPKDYATSIEVLDLARRGFGCSITPSLCV